MDPEPGEGRPFEVRVFPGDGAEYVFIPAGSFVMGASTGDEAADPAEHPAHRVVVTEGFWLARTPVTVAEYRRFCEATGRRMPEPIPWNRGWAHEDRPMVNVGWAGALAYCRWAGARLPNEAEWEYAARAGTTARYWWGDAMDGEKAWYRGNAGGMARDVATRPANPWGLFDMLGNVWEWCADAWNPDHRGASSRAEVRTGDESMHVLRGGSFLNTARGLRVSYRAGFPNVGVAPYCGFRCAR